MLRIIKWAYDLGVKTEHKRIHDELLLRIGNRPEPLSFKGGEIADRSYYPRLEAWGEAQRMIRDYFGAHSDITTDELERMLLENKL